MGLSETDFQTSVQEAFSDANASDGLDEDEDEDVFFDDDSDDDSNDDNDNEGMIVIQTLLVKEIQKLKIGLI